MPPPERPGLIAVALLAEPADHLEKPVLLGLLLREHAGEALGNGLRAVRMHATRSPYTEGCTTPPHGADALRSAGPRVAATP